MTITSTPDGPRYSAATRSGQQIVSGATLDDLRDRYPDVYRFVHPAMALDVTADNRRREVVPWAGTDVPPEPTDFAGQSLNVAPSIPVSEELGN